MQDRPPFYAGAGNSAVDVTSADFGTGRERELILLRARTAAAEVAYPDFGTPEQLARDRAPLRWVVPAHLAVPRSEFCPAGHWKDRVDNAGYRVCSICAAERSRRHYQAKKARGRL